jgi:C4-type Zn-finger protein
VAVNTKIKINQSNQYDVPLCGISIEFYSTSTEAPFEKTIIINNYFYYYDIALRGLINSP